MQTIRLKISDLLQFEGSMPSEPMPDLTAVIPMVSKQFTFLPQPLTISIEGDEVVLQ